MRNPPEGADMDCDAPPYPIIRACRKLGFQTPEDVRWCRRQRGAAQPTAGWKLLAPRLWDLLLGRRKATARPAGCSCAQRPPALHRCTFTMSSGREVGYMIGQCPRCRTIVWEPAR
jgi:hypothetical protein